MSKVAEYPTYSDELVALASALARLKTGYGLVDSKVDSLAGRANDLAEGAWNYDSWDAKRLTIGLSAIQQSIQTFERQFLIKLAEQSRLIGEVLGADGRLILPSSIKSIFEAAFEKFGGSRSQLTAYLADHPGKAVFWKPYEDIEGSKRDFCDAFIFPEAIPDSLIEVWWGLASGYSSPSYLSKLNSGMWQATFVEE